MSVEIDFTVTGSAAISDWPREEPGVEVSVSLIWDALSGWKLFRSRDSVQQERWLGQGLVPAPARLEAFILNHVLEFAELGMGQDVSPMLDAFAHSLACRAADEPASAGTSERIRTLAAAQWAQRLGPA